MADYQEVKAGPSDSELPLEWTAPTSSTKWQRRGNALLKAITVTVLFVLGYFLFIRITEPKAKSDWAWKLKLDDEPSEKGSKYLLGVGKADITGYFCLSPGPNRMLIMI